MKDKQNISLSQDQFQHLDLFFKRKKLSIITDPNFTPEQKEAWNELHDILRQNLLDHFSDTKKEKT